jgi:predicted lipid-binding transport protein (Tim44 family)
MPTDILIYMIVAAVMVFWLKSVLGTKHGEERERPNPFDPKNQPDEEMAKGEKPLEPINMHAETIQQKNATGDKDVDAGLVQIALADKTFDVPQFKENAADAFSIIVTAFADGDRDTLRDLCKDDVYRAFDQAIREREKKGETVSTEIHAVRKTEITNAEVDTAKNANVTIRFTADETYVIKDKRGEILAGHPDRVTEMVDKWTFARNVRSSDPRWFLARTEDDVEEADGKTPLPDAG